jgi:hypothetical protein
MRIIETLISHNQFNVVSCSRCWWITPEHAQQALLFVPYQRRAASHGKCGIEVEGGTLPIQHWFLNLKIATSGGFL